MGVALLGLCAGFCFAQDDQEAPKPAPPPAAKSSFGDAPKAVSLETNEALFTVLSAVNYCGYDAELSVSDPVREVIRNEVRQAVQSTAEMAEAGKSMCDYYSEHQQGDSSRTLAQYVSLALFLNPPPALDLKAKEAEIPPDAVAVIGFVPMLQNFYKQAGIHDIWQRHAAQFSALSERYHAPLAKMMFDTEIYLRLPSAGYLGRGFTVYIDPMGAPGQTNARNYGSDYYTIISPGTNASLKMEQLRHTYLHYLLDPLVLKYPGAMRRLEPLTDVVKNSPMEPSFKSDISLLVTECFIRAVEARTSGNAKAPETDRQKMVQNAVEQGFVLTSYFYNALLAFEKDAPGMREVFSDMLVKIDVGSEVKRAGQVQFASKAESELLRQDRPVRNKLLNSAEQKLSAGDKDGAQKLAQQVLDEKTEDAGRALFILAEVASMNGQMEGAREYFLKALDSTQEPKVVAWAHIYLGRIYDLQEDRESALRQYKAALIASASLPDAKSAAQRGIDKAYEPARRPE